MFKHSSILSQRLKQSVGYGIHRESWNPSPTDTGGWRCKSLPLRRLKSGRRKVGQMKLSRYLLYKNKGLSLNPHHPHKTKTNQPNRKTTLLPVPVTPEPKRQREADRGSLLSSQSSRKMSSFLWPLRARTLMHLHTHPPKSGRRVQQGSGRVRKTSVSGILEEKRR